MKKESIGGQKRKAKMAFGSIQQRPLLPSSIPMDRMGIALCSNSSPHLGPGSYDCEKITSLSTSLNNRKFSKRGWGFGARTSDRVVFPKQTMDVPAPCDLQPDQSAIKTFKQNQIPFGIGTPRFLDYCKSEDIPGPGTYSNEMEQKRQYMIEGSFGGPITIVPPVTIKCVEENSDRCYLCRSSPVGDYYCHRKEVLCRQCYKNQWETENVLSKRKLMTFIKVRDCSFMHDHQGTPAAIQLVNAKDLKKLQRREAYLSKYYS
ncbi:ciliary microtubule-associated protein 3 isoform X1 [Tachypleus tridentatus]|uniref:ciliary microtubule-associated protein 3 isoform X1 n=1 Tax=Tachypleus tridentatus TaxID=6853 RepID=UPI003FD46AA8